MNNSASVAAWLNAPIEVQIVCDWKYVQWMEVWNVSSSPEHKIVRYKNAFLNNYMWAFYFKYVAKICNVVMSLAKWRELIQKKARALAPRRRYNYTAQNNWAYSYTIKVIDAYSITNDVFADLELNPGEAGGGTKQKCYRSTQPECPIL